MSKNSVGLSEPAYRYILDLIMTRQLMPGDRIPETRIAQEFNISRTPVRDAMRQLSNAGLIEIFPNRFAQVRVYSIEEVEDIGVLRVALDSLAIKLACHFGSRADFIELAKIAEDCSAAFARGDDAERRALDSAFHMELARIAKNQLLIKYSKELYLRVQFILLHHPNPVEDENNHLHQHIEIAEALMQHDEKTACRIITDHLTSFYGLRNRYPENFFDMYR